MSFWQQIARTARSTLESNRFFYTSLTLFAIGVVWTALSSIYPMAFDEEFHYGLIKIYATSWLPYGIEHTSDMAQYGSATADASYLFHYLMSFPYRLFHSLALSDQTIIILLRLINISFVTSALVLFRKALLGAGIGKITTNLSMIFFMLIPVLSLLAAQINYDNLLLLIVAYALLLTITITRNILTNKGLPASATWMLLIMLLYGMSVKYAFLPIVAGIGFWCIGLIFFTRQKFKTKLLTQLAQFTQSTKRLSKPTKILLISTGVLGVFFASHYVVNYASYGSPIPSCEAVFDENACMAYGPWNRNRLYAIAKDTSFQALSLPSYIVVHWIPGMTERLTFAVAGKTNDFQTKSPLLVVLIVFVTLTIIGFICLIIRLFFKRSTVTWFTWFTLLLCMVYAGVLVSQLYGDYKNTAIPVAINGRYLLLLLPLFGAVLIESIAIVAKRIPSNIALLLLLIVLLLLVFGGGGVGTYIIQSESHWCWPGFGQASHAILQTIWNGFTLH